MIPILIAITIVALEIYYDKKQWAKDKNDKPISTYLRLGCFVLYFVLTIIIQNDWIYALLALFLSASTFFLLFDSTLNVVRWKVLPEPYWWRIEQNKTNWFQKKVLWPIMKFSKRFFWHGDKNTKSFYDRIFQRIPYQGELLLKGAVLYTAIYLYFNY